MKQTSNPPYTPPGSFPGPEIVAAANFYTSGGIGEHHYVPAEEPPPFGVSREIWRVRKVQYQQKTDGRSDAE